MPLPAFVHLRLHSEYSISDGMVRVDDAIAAARDDAMPALALTDLNNFFGLIKFYKAARGAGVKPIAGCDVFITNDADRDRPYRLLLLCQSTAGYLLLCRLLSRAYLENQHRGRAELRREWLHQSTDGLIALSGAHLGDVGSALLSGNASQARQFAQEWAALFATVITLRCSAPDSPTKNFTFMPPRSSPPNWRLPVVATHPGAIHLRRRFQGARGARVHRRGLCAQRQTPGQTIHRAAIFQDAGRDGGAVRRSARGAAK